MTTDTPPFGKELIRPAQRPQQKKAAKRRKKVAGPLKAFVGPCNLEQALGQAVPAHRRQAIAAQSGSDARAQQLTFEPYLRALRVRPIAGGSRHDRREGRAHDPL